ncbi:MAG: chromosomal replication initiator protein DnaA [candidate division WOR-3 bacterium]
MQSSPKLIWQNIIDLISEILPQKNTKDWLSSIKPMNIENNIIYLQAPNEYFAEWIEEHYGTYLRDALKKFQITDIKWVFEEKRPTLFKPQIEISTLQRTLTFENFIIGKENEILYNIAISIAKNPSKTYNPFYVYGKSGLGKTHLINAIGNKAIEYNSKIKVKYITMEAFFNELINAIKTQTTNSFRNKYRELNMLIVDNFDFIEDKPSLQEEFLNSLDYLLSKNSQVILAGIKHIKNLKVREEIKNRILKGIIMEIEPPTIETRYNILKLKVKEEGLNIDDELLWEIAKENISSIRELEGVVARISAYYNFSDDKINYRTFKSLILDLVSTKKQYDISKIIQVVCEKLKVDEGYLKSPIKVKDLLYARYVVIYIAREKFHIPYTKIAKALNRDHSTIINGYNKARKLIIKDKEFQKLVEKVEKAL